MKETPILFSGPMVLAILEGRKTQTRRVVKPQPFEFCGPMECRWYTQSVVRNGMFEPGREVFGFADEDNGWVSPYGAPVDRLWVRETWRPWRHPGIGTVRATYLADGTEAFVKPESGWVFPDDDDLSLVKEKDKNPPRWIACKKRPSIFMPRWASRITLEITKVRVEKVQDIGYSGSVAEGVEDDGLAVDRYQTLWDVLNAKRGFPWSSNPWVFVIEFKRVA